MSHASSIRSDRPPISSRLQRALSAVVAADATVPRGELLAWLGQPLDLHSASKLAEVLAAVAPSTHAHSEAAEGCENCEEALLTVHRALLRDIAGSFAAAEGVVIRTGYQPEGYGRFVEVAHPNGMTTLYAHMSRVDVASGMAVTGEDRLGLVGSTGYSTGPHLHFEVRRGGTPINPARVLDRTFEVVVIEAP